MSISESEKARRKREEERRRRGTYPAGERDDWGTYDVGPVEVGPIVSGPDYGSTSCTDVGGGDCGSASSGGDCG